MLKPFYNEETLEAEGETFRLVLNFRAIDAIESLLGEPFDSVLEELGGERQRLGLAGKVLWGLLREHHGALSLDHAAALMFGEAGVAAGMAVQRLLDAAFPGAEAGKTKGENPPQPRGASSAS
jgi:hypothetical protein